MFFVYQRPTKKVHEFKDFSTLIEHFKDSHLANSPDLFWTLGLKSWIPISDALTDNIIKKKKYQIPSLPAEVLQEESAEALNKSNTKPTKPAVDIDENTQPGIPLPIHDDVTREIRIEDSDFVIVSYEQPTTAKAPPPKPTIPAGGKPAALAPKKDPKDYAEQRRAPRYDVRLKVIISNKEKTFLSYTVNVSTGGVMLEDKIPAEYFNAETEIFISSPKKNEFVAFRCFPVGDDAEPKRFTFGQISDTSLQKFNEWMTKIK